MFWNEKSLFEFNKEEWESLCDRCGKCCLLKLHDESSDIVFMTSLSCSLLDCEKASCIDYPNRQKKVSECIVLTPKNFEQQLDLLPSTCAYRLVYENKDLPQWHPLITGDIESATKSANSVVGRVRPCNEVSENDYEDFVVEWPL